MLWLVMVNVGLGRGAVVDVAESFLAACEDGVCRGAC